jgi:O-antigen biosynthesis protein WbqP
MDFVISLIGLLVLSPFLIIIALIIKLESQGKILFTQKRVGKDKVLFNIYKFRSMVSETPKDTPTHLLNDPSRFITKSGAFLRKSSLDELPQLLNILKGDMSIVGPRPALWNQDDLIAERDKFRANDVVPGLTGWAQINGRDELPIVEKAKLDGYYVSHISLFLDIKIFFLTIFKVLKSDGVREGGQK